MKLFKTLSSHGRCELSDHKKLCRECSLSSSFIFSATVDLATSRGRFEFDASVTAPDLIKEYVDDLGFAADVVTAASASMEREEVVSKCGVEIEGMSCQSCVRNIEGTIGELGGVKDIKVRIMPT